MSLSSKLCGVHGTQMNELFTSTFCKRCDEEKANPVVALKIDGKMVNQMGFRSPGQNITYSTTVAPVITSIAGSIGINPTPSVPLDMMAVDTVVRAGLANWQATGGKIVNHDGLNSNIFLSVPDHYGNRHWATNSNKLDIVEFYLLHNTLPLIYSGYPLPIATFKDATTKNYDAVYSFLAGFDAIPGVNVTHWDHFNFGADLRSLR